MIVQGERLPSASLRVRRRYICWGEGILILIIIPILISSLSLRAAVFCLCFEERLPSTSLRVRRRYMFRMSCCSGG